MEERDTRRPGSDRRENRAKDRPAGHEFSVLTHIPLTGWRKCGWDTLVGSILRTYAAYYGYVGVSVTQLLGGVRRSHSRIDDLSIRRQEAGRAARRVCVSLLLLVCWGPSCVSEAGGALHPIAVAVRMYDRSKNSRKIVKLRPSVQLLHPLHPTTYPPQILLAPGAVGVPREQ